MVQLDPEVALERDKAKGLPLCNECGMIGHTKLICNKRLAYSNNDEYFASFIVNK